MKTTLRARKKFGFIDATIKKPNEESPDLKDTINLLLESWLRNTIEPTLRSTIETLICTQNWLRSTLIGKQIVQPTEEETEFYEEVELDFEKLSIVPQSQDVEQPQAAEDLTMN